jgi:hypothetical protein
MVGPVKRHEVLAYWVDWVIEPNISEDEYADFQDDCNKTDS